MEDMLPVLVFVIMIIIGNVLDKKKPPAKSIPLPGRRLPDIEIRIPPLRHKKQEKPAETTDAYAIPQEPDVNTNPYQRYLEGHEAARKYADTEAAPGGLPEYGSRRRENALAAVAGGNATLAQGIVLAEILGKPKSLQRGAGRRRY